MDVRRQDIKISRNNKLNIWELRYGNHPRVISYSDDWELLDKLSTSIIRDYFKKLEILTLQMEAWEISN